MHFLQRRIETLVDTDQITLSHVVEAFDLRFYNFEIPQDKSGWSLQITVKNGDDERKILCGNVDATDQLKLLTWRESNGEKVYFRTENRGVTGAGSFEYIPSDLTTNFKKSSGSVSFGEPILRAGPVIELVPTKPSTYEVRLDLVE